MFGMNGDRVTTKATAISALVGIATLIAGYVEIRWAVAIAAALSTFVLVLVVVRSRDEVLRLIRKLNADVIEAKAQLSFLDNSRVTPAEWSRTSIPATALLKVLETVDDRNCRMIVECGCGESTVRIGQFLRSRGSGHLVSIEEDEFWASKIATEIKRNALDDWATVIYKPLIEVHTCDRSTRWYDLSEGIPVERGRVDLLLVDGPVGANSPLTRLGAVPFLWPYLSADAAIILDDALRPDEQEITQIWCERFQLKASTWRIGHGMVLFERNKPGGY
jgi:hypothetical protein